MAALAHELSRRGHVVTFLHHEGVEKDIRGRGLDFVSLGRRADYVASLESVLRGAGTLKAALGLPALMRDFARTTARSSAPTPRGGGSHRNTGSTAAPRALRRSPSSRRPWIIPAAR